MYGECCAGVALKMDINVFLVVKQDRFGVSVYHMYMGAVIRYSTSSCDCFPCLVAATLYP